MLFNGISRYYEANSSIIAFVLFLMSSLSLLFFTFFPTVLMSWKITIFIYHFPYSIFCTLGTALYITCNDWRIFLRSPKFSRTLCYLPNDAIFVFTAPTNNEDSRKTHKLQGINEAEFCRSFISGWGLGRPPRGCLLPSGRHTCPPTTLVVVLDVYSELSCSYLAAGSSIPNCSCILLLGERYL